MLEMETCRICLEAEFPSKMISPCNCKGTQKFVHQKCLQIWDLNHQNSIKKCEICKCEYKKTHRFLGVLKFLSNLLFSKETMKIAGVVIYCMMV
mmetsp:Transcript_2739/g.2479  ORF Transcript_2739/g.2479 Transcript_2739/m.2479 type:complete len:94 (+) Transcript_2739:3-284(+)